jgi:hypothetical protein
MIDNRCCVCTTNRRRFLSIGRARELIVVSIVALYSLSILLRIQLAMGRIDNQPEKQVAKQRGKNQFV